MKQEDWTAERREAARLAMHSLVIEARSRAYATDPGVAKILDGLDDLLNIAGPRDPSDWSVFEAAADEYCRNAGAATSNELLAAFATASEAATLQTA